MTSFYFPFALAVAGMLFYHLAQKSIPREMNPFHATIIAYAIGIGLCFVCAFAYPGKRSIIGLGFLLAYPAGWKIGVAAVANNVAVTAMLIPIGILVFKDHLSLRNMIGLIFCVLGLVLVVRD